MTLLLAPGLLPLLLAFSAVCPRVARAQPCARAAGAAPGDAVASFPVELMENLVLFRVRVNQSAPAWFMLDSGLEFSVVNSDRAAALGLRVSNPQAINEPGGTSALGTVAGVTLRLPSGLALPFDTLHALPLASVEPALGRPIAGILGHDVFLRYVVRIDYARRIVTLFEPDRFQAAGGAASVPVSIEEDQPFVSGALIQRGRPPIPAKLKVDVGSADALGLNGSFVQATHLVGPADRRVPQPGVALGGETQNWVTRLAAMRIGPFVLNGPVAGYSADTLRKGDAGTVGGESLRRFTVTFDYARHRLLLRPNSRLHDPFRYDASGAFLVTAGVAFDTIVVAGVAPESPAARVGLERGDVLLAVDGVPATALGVSRVRRLFRQAGRTLRLTVRHGSAQRTLLLPLRRLL